MVAECGSFATAAVHVDTVGCAALAQDRGRDASDQHRTINRTAIQWEHEDENTGEGTAAATFSSLAGIDCIP